MRVLILKGNTTDNIKMTDFVSISETRGISQGRMMDASLDCAHSTE